MTKEDYIIEHNIRKNNFANKDWLDKQSIIEKDYVENFIKSEPPTKLFLERLNCCLLEQKWISAKSSTHQYTLMKDFVDIDGIEFNDITKAIGKYGFFGYYWCDLHQYLIIGEFYYWSSLYPCSWELINRARIDTPPKEAYFSNFQGVWAEVGKPNIKCYSFPSNPFTGEQLERNPFNGNSIREFIINPENFKYSGNNFIDKN